MWGRSRLKLVVVMEVGMERRDQGQGVLCDIQLLALLLAVLMVGHPHRRLVHFIHLREDNFSTRIRILSNRRIRNHTRIRNHNHILHRPINTLSRDPVDTRTQTRIRICRTTSSNRNLPKHSKGYINLSRMEADTNIRMAACLQLDLDQGSHTPRIGLNMIDYLLPSRSNSLWWIHKLYTHYHHNISLIISSNDRSP
jgi:hypothetical protein